jgi:hypothetical protein
MRLMYVAAFHLMYQLIASVKMLVLWPLWRALDALVWAKVR